MVQAVAAGAGMVTTALANQRKRELPVRSQFESIVPALAVTPKRSHRQTLINQSREERIWDLITQPEVLGLVATFAGVMAAQNIRFVATADNGSDLANEGIQSIATMVAILLGLGHAGVGDLTTAILAGLGGVASLVEGIGLPELPDLTGLAENDALLAGLTGILPFGLGNALATFKLFS